jgi:archaellum component FlaG (FlaF/FlaG flagellin family)
MSELFLFVFGLIVTALAVGPLAYAALLDAREEDQD